MESRATRLQDITSGILKDCYETTSERRKQYGGGVFIDAAELYNAIYPHEQPIDNMVVHRVMIVMKLARYGYQLTARDKNEHTTQDSLKDLLVYLALAEAERRIQNEERQACSPEEVLRPSDGKTEKGSL